MIRHVFLEVGFKFLVLTCDQSGSSQLYYSVGLLLKLFDHLKELLAILSSFYHVDFAPFYAIFVSLDKSLIAAQR